MITLYSPWINYHYRKPAAGKSVIITWLHKGDKHFKEFKSFDATDLGFLEDIEHVWWTLSPFKNADAD